MEWQSEVGTELHKSGKQTNATSPSHSYLGLPGVWSLTGQSGFFGDLSGKNMTLNWTISCPVFGRP